MTIPSPATLAASVVELDHRCQNPRREHDCAICDRHAAKVLNLINEQAGKAQ